MANQLAKVNKLIAYEAVQRFTLPFIMLLEC